MTIRELMTAHPDACLATDSCAAALGIMRRRECGFVPIVDSHITDQVIGVVTDRDIALYLERVDCAPSDAILEGCMTRNPKTIAPEAKLEEAAHLMERAAVQRLPVVECGRLVGVLSLKDIASLAQKPAWYWGAKEAERQVTEIVEAIAASR